MVTPMQHRTYQFIRHYLLQYGYAPTEAEIANGIGIRSRGVAHRYVQALARERLVKLIPNKKRNVRLIEGISLPSGRMPILGKIAAGEPIDFIEDQRALDIAESLLGANRFAIEVQGDSMSGDNICHGDYIICERCDRVDDDRIVVVMIDKREVTLKRVQYQDDGTVLLIPSNPNVVPMRYSASRIQVQGAYLGLLRLSG